MNSNSNPNLSLFALIKHYFDWFKIMLLLPCKIGRQDKWTLSKEVLLLSLFTFTFTFYTIQTESMEERYKYLEGIDGGKTFSIRRRIPKIMENDKDFEVIPEPTQHVNRRDPTLHKSKQSREEASETPQNPQNPQKYLGIEMKRSEEFLAPSLTTFSEFISQDRNVYFQRKILMQQEQLQKHTAKVAAMKYSTKGLLPSEEPVDESKENIQDSDNKYVKSWPQCKYNEIVSSLILFLFLFLFY